MSLYIPILISIRRQQKQIHASEETSKGKSHKGTVVLCAVIVYYFISYTPILIANTIPETFDRPVAPSTNDTLSQFVNSLGVFAWAPSFVNPFLYGMLNKSFRTELFGYCTCCISYR